MGVTCLVLIKDMSLNVVLILQPPQHPYIYDTLNYVYSGYSLICHNWFQKNNMVVRLVSLADKLHIHWYLYITLVLRTGKLWQVERFGR